MQNVVAYAESLETRKCCTHIVANALTSSITVKFLHFNFQLIPISLFNIFPLLNLFSVLWMKQLITPKNISGERDNLCQALHCILLNEIH